MKKWIMLCVTLLLFSCGTLKKTTEKTSTTNTKENMELVTDSTKTTEISKEIENAVKILATKSDLSDAELNRIVDRKVDEILSKMNISGQSGDNNYSLMYDQVKRELLLQMKVGESKTETTSTNKSEKVEKSFEQTTDEYISKKVSMIPWWAYALVLFWFLPQIIEKFTLIINPIKGLIAKKT